MQKRTAPKWFYGVLVSIPILFILFLELTLQFFDYGKNLEQWIKVGDESLILNPEIGARYFSNIKNYPHSNNDSFDRIKKENSYRVFVLGGSSAAGFPYQPNGSFSRYLRDRLQLDFTKHKIEVINLGITAVNTYTIIDLLPGVIEQKPDLIIFYAGHNEFYGALGVGSLETLGSSNFIISLFLKLNKFKTFQLVQQFIKSTMGLLASKNTKAPGKTLMARMALEKVIKFNSNTYKAGVEQFRNNLNHILSTVKRNNIPIIIGTLASNLKNQSPFISTSFNGISASEVYDEAQRELNNNNIKIADSLFRLAKDLDGLRFRAPDEFNTIIKKEATKYNSTVVNIQKLFNEFSKNKIIGSELMVDHLHPNLDGYMLMGRLFYDEIIKSNFGPDESENVLTKTKQDSIIKSEFAFTRLDSMSSKIRITNLLNDWPFVKKKNYKAVRSLHLKDRIDSLAYNIVFKNLNWRVAHDKASQWYLSNNDYYNFAKEIKTILSQYPYKRNYYNYASEHLIKVKRYDLANYFLQKKYFIEPDKFSTKWLGNLALFRKENQKAIKYLNESIQFDKTNAQNFYNLAIAYLNIKKFNKSKEAIKACLILNPNYKNALNLLSLLNKETD